MRNDDDLRHIWNDILERQLTGLDKWFQEDQYGKMRAAGTFLPQSKTFAQKESPWTPCDYHDISVEDTELTIEQLHGDWNFHPSWKYWTFVLLTFFQHSTSYFESSSYFP